MISDLSDCVPHLPAAQCKAVITCNQGVRGGRFIDLKPTVDAAVKNCPNVQHVFVAQRTTNPTPMGKLDIPLEEVILVLHSSYCAMEEVILSLSSGTSQWQSCNGIRLHCRQALLTDGSGELREPFCDVICHVKICYERSLYLSVLSSAIVTDKMKHLEVFCLQEQPVYSPVEQSA